MTADRVPGLALPAPAGELAPAGWRRIASYVAETGWPAILAMSGELADPVQLAQAEAADLARSGADIRLDGTGHWCANPDDPVIRGWAADLADGADDAADKLETAMRAVLDDG